jgi:hypothetical protein
MANTLTVTLPASLHNRIKQFADIEGISINQFLVTAVAEKMSALSTQTYLEQEAAKGNRADFEKVLRAVPNVEPEAHDRKR